MLYGSFVVYLLLLLIGSVIKGEPKVEQKEIVYFGHKLILACDGKCEKAWGINSRPKEKLDANNPDDYCFLADNELGDAPEDPGTYEGDHAKPIAGEPKLNKWCCRECERSEMVKPGEEIVLKDFSKRSYNIPI
jgi:hypothetical protein